MKTKQGLAAIGVVLAVCFTIGFEASSFPDDLASPGHRSAYGLSIDQASPEYPGINSSADIIPFHSVGQCWYSATDLGLPETAEINGFSTHRFLLCPGAPTHATFYFSVSRTSQGQEWTAVWWQINGGSANGAAGDVFISTYGILLPSNNILFHDSSSLGLSPLPGESNIDGLSMMWACPVYFTLADSTTIYYQSDPGPNAPPPTVYLTLPGNDVNAISVCDYVPVGVWSENPTVYFDLSDRVWYSLKGDANIYWASANGGRGVVVEASDIGLLPTDDVDALEGTGSVHLSLLKWLRILGFRGFGRPW